MLRHRDAPPFAACALVILALSSLGAQPGSGAVTYWSQNAAAGADNWTTASNWDGSAAPVSDLTTDIATFKYATYDSQPGISAGCNVGGIQVEGSSCNVTIGNSAILTVGSLGIKMLDGSGNLAFTGTAALTAASASGSRLINLDPGSGTLTFNGQVSIPSGALTQIWYSGSSNPVTMGSVAGGNGRPLVIDGGGNFTVTGQFDDGTSAVTKNGSGTLTIGSLINNSVWTINAGTVQFNGATGTNGGVTLNGGTFQFGPSGAMTAANTIWMNSGLLRIGSAASLGTYMTTVVFGAGSTGKVQLNGVDTGVIYLATDATACSPVIENGGNTNATLSVYLSPGSTSKTYAGVIRDSDGLGATGTLTLTYAGGGPWTLTGANTYTGGTNISGSTIRFASGSLGSAGNIALSSPSTLQWNGANADDISSRLRMENGASVTLDTGANNVVFANGIGSNSGGGPSSASLTKAGTGMLTLCGTSTYTGKTYINAGTLLATSPAALAGWDRVGYINIYSGTLAVQDWSDADVATLLSKNSLSGNSLGLYVTSGASIYSTLLKGTLSLVKGGAGTAVLGAANTYVGTTTVSAGTLRLSGGANRLPSGTNVTVSGNAAGITATLDLNGQDQTIGMLTLGGATSTSGAAITTGSGTLSLRGNLTYDATGNSLAATIDGKLALGAGSGIVTVNHSTSAARDLVISAAIAGLSAPLSKYGAGTLTLSGANTYPGGTILSAGVLRVGSEQALGVGRLTMSSNNVVLSGDGTAARSLANSIKITANVTLGDATNNGALTLGPVDLGGAARDLTINSDVMFASGSTNGGLGNKLGDGTLVLSGDNTYAVTTTVSRGKLTVNGSLASQAVTVSNTASLGGTGAAAGDVTIQTGGHIAPGNSLGTLTLTGNLSLAAGALLDFELGTPGLCDQIAMPSSTLFLSGQQFSDFNFTPLDGFGPGTYTLIDAGTIQGDLGLTTTGTINGFSASLAKSGNDVVLNIVPEPSTFALLGVGAISLLGLVWRRRKRATRPK